MYCVKQTGSQHSMYVRTPAGTPRARRLGMCCASACIGASAFRYSVKVCARVGPIERREGHSAKLHTQSPCRVVWDKEMGANAVFFIRGSKFLITARGGCWLCLR